MTEQEILQKAPAKTSKLRIWPAILLLAGMLIARLTPLSTQEESMTLMVLSIVGPLLIGVGILLWWITFSRATGKEKFIGSLGVVLAATLAIVFIDKTMMGPGIIIVTVPIGMAAFAIGTILFRKSPVVKRTVIAVLIAACGFGSSTLLKNNGMWGNGALDLNWRWQSSAEQKMMGRKRVQFPMWLLKTEANEIDQWLSEPKWPRFRGPKGISQQQGIKFATDWSVNPPQEIWRRSVGPGWSSFVIAGNLLYTQEQLGDDEAVVCYAAETGKEIWMHKIESRFFDPLGGPGPRATPTLSGDSVFAMGANGQLQSLNAKTGDLIWSKDIQEIAERKPPEWGFSSSPLCIGSVVVVHAGGKGDKGTLAFDRQTGNLKWSAAAGDHSYCSPESGTFDGEDYVLMLSNAGLSIVDPESGKEVLNHQWKHSGYRVLQPRVLDDQSILLATQMAGTRRIKIKGSDDGSLNAEELWTSRFLKPDFNDFVVHENHAYGFDGLIFTCIDLATGERKWKKGRYGKGQVFLLADSNVLLVMSEKGEIVLLETNSSESKELARLTVLSDRTWNHPVVVGDKLFVRNSAEAACYRLPIASEVSN